MNGLRVNELYKPKQDAHIAKSLEFSGKSIDRKSTCVLKCYHPKYLFHLVNFPLLASGSFSLHQSFVLGSYFDVDGIGASVN